MNIEWGFVLFGLFLPVPEWYLGIRTGRTDVRYLLDRGGVGATDGCPRWLGGPVPAGSAVQGAACMKVQCNGDFYPCRETQIF